jgi:hypothetical protein
MAAYGTSTLGAKLRSGRYGTTADDGAGGVVVFRSVNGADATTLPTAGSIRNVPADPPQPARQPRRPAPPTPPWAKRDKRGPGPRPGR